MNAEQKAIRKAFMAGFEEEQRGGGACYLSRLTSVYLKGRLIARELGLYPGALSEYDDPVDLTQPVQLGPPTEPPALLAAAKEAVRHFDRDGVHDLDQCSPLDALRAAVEAVAGRRWIYRVVDVNGLSMGFEYDNEEDAEARADRFAGAFVRREDVPADCGLTACADPKHRAVEPEPVTCRPSIRSES